MVRLIAPACPYCSAQMTVLNVYANFDGQTRLDPIDLNLARWRVEFSCPACWNTSDRPFNEAKAPLGHREPAKGVDPNVI